MSPPLHRLNGERELWKVVGNLYGLSEAPITWYLRLVEIMGEVGMLEVKRGWSIFSNGVVHIQAYVDD